MPSLLRFRLSLMMLLQYAVMGSVLPILSLYLRNNLGFSGTQTGTVLAMSALAASTAPFIGALVADRLLSTERLLALCHLLAAVLMFLLSRQSSFWLVLALYLCYMVAIRPTVALTNAVAFHHMPGERSRFAGIRVWGTAGWMIVGWAFSYAWLRGDNAMERLPDALLLASGLSLIMFLHCLTLPDGRTPERGRPSALPTEALRILREPDIAILALVNFIMFMLFQYYYVGAAPYLEQIGFAERHIMPAMSLGQVTEVGVMLALPTLMRTLPIKGLFALGVLSEICRFTCLLIGAPSIVVLLGLACHGSSIALFMMASLIYLDHRCSPSSRSGAHQLFTIITMGFAALAGSLIAGQALDVFTTATGTVSFRLFWVIPGVLAAAALVVVLVFFPGAETKAIRRHADDDPHGSHTADEPMA